MAQDRSAPGSAISALGAAVLAVSVFLPWYAFSLTASGVTSAQESLANAVAHQYGNTAFQSAASGLERALRLARRPPARNAERPRRAEISEHRPADPCGGRARRVAASSPRCLAAPERSSRARRGARGHLRAVSDARPSRAFGRRHRPVAELGDLACTRGIRRRRPRGRVAAGEDSQPSRPPRSSRRPSTSSPAGARRPDLAAPSSARPSLSSGPEFQAAALRCRPVYSGFAPRPRLPDRCYADSGTTTRRLRRRSSAASTRTMSSP